jgi:hypothetical protein
MKDPWEKTYVYGRMRRDGKIAHVARTTGAWDTLCDAGLILTHLNRTPKPYPVCKNCLRTKRAKELGLLDGVPNLRPRLRNEELP